jgi:hypothetical protein
LRSVRVSGPLFSGTLRYSRERKMKLKIYEETELIIPTKATNRLRDEERVAGRSTKERR